MPRFTFFMTMARTRAILAPALVCLFLAALYLHTMPPGLTWAYDGADGGDLVTAAATGGVPHPTGYPTYVLAASAFLRIPIGSLAWRTNLLSAACSVLAALVIYLLVRDWVHSPLAASVASLAYGTFPLVWSQAIITEVYALNGLFAALILYMCWRGGERRWTIFAGGLAAGLALGNHLSTILMLPLLLIAERDTRMIVQDAETGPATADRGAGSMAWRIAGVLGGLLVYLVIPLRARMQAPLNWGNAIHWDGFIWLVTGRAYWSRLGDFNPGYLWTGVQAWSHLILQQLGIVGLVLVAVVLGVVFKRSWMYLACSWLVLAYSALAILFYSPDSYVYLIPALLAISIWMGVGAGWIVERASARFRRLKIAAAAILVAYVALRAVLAVPSISLSTDRRAEQYAQAILESAPAGAMIFTAGDEATFSVWYLHYAYHERPDVAVISSDLLVQPWYRAVLKYTYPDLIMQENALPLDIVRDNPARPACYAGPDLQASIRCSP